MVRFQNELIIKVYKSLKKIARAIAAGVFGPGSSLSKLARISFNTASFRRLDPGPMPRRIASRELFLEALNQIEFGHQICRPTRIGLNWRAGDGLA